jgi:hypothetical protein
MNRTMATEPIELLDETAFNNMTDALSTDPLSIGDLLRAFMRGGFPGFEGMAYVLLSAGILYLMWQDQRSLTLPAIFLMMFGGLLFTFIPESIALYLQLAAILGLAVVLHKLYRDGRQ